MEFEGKTYKDFECVQDLMEHAYERNMGYFTCDENEYDYVPVKEKSTGKLYQAIPLDGNSYEMVLKDDVGHKLLVLLKDIIENFNYAKASYMTAICFW